VKPLPAPLDAVVFDLDGTLVDTAADLQAHVNHVLGELGRPGLELEEVRLLVGDGARTLLRRGLEASGGIPAGVELDLLYARFLERYTADPARRSRVHDGVVPVLRGLTARAVRLGVCTNKAQAPTDRLLSALGLDEFFEAVVGGDAVPAKKPDAGHLRAVLERLGAAPARAVMVGDSGHDLLAARALGVPCILVSFGYTPVPARAWRRAGDRPLRGAAGRARKPGRRGGLTPAEAHSHFPKWPLDTARARHLIAAYGDGRLAQRESTRFTRAGSLVQSQHRPPSAAAFAHRITSFGPCRCRRGCALMGEGKSSIRG
jgi:phosphoglycolate phosphatase